jgi:hypothetical protein
MSFGSEPLDMWQRAASYVDRILSRWPVINFSTAKATRPTTLNGTFL